MITTPPIPPRVGSVHTCGGGGGVRAERSNRRSAEHRQRGPPVIGHVIVVESGATLANGSALCPFGDPNIV